MYPVHSNLDSTNRNPFEIAKDNDPSVESFQKIPNPQGKLNKIQSEQ